MFRLEFSTLKTRTKTGAELTFTNTSRDHYWERATELPQNSENKPRGLYFSKALFEGPIFGGAYLRREICISKIDWASLIVGGKFTIFALFYFVFGGNFPSTSPRAVYIWRGDLTEGFLLYRFGGLIFGRAYTWRGLFSEFYRIGQFVFPVPSNSSKTAFVFVCIKYKQVITPDVFNHPFEGAGPPPTLSKKRLFIVKWQRPCWISSLVLFISHYLHQ